MPQPEPIVFLCYASEDKPAVRKLYKRLNAEGWIDSWLDEEKIRPGRDWDLEIKKAVEAAAVVIVCVSENSVTKQGYIQKELKYVLDVADEKPEGTPYIITLRLSDVDVSRFPSRLRRLQYLDFYTPKIMKWAYPRLLDSIKERFRNLGIVMREPITLSKPITLTKGKRQSLIGLAIEARRLAYAPYSHYLVGAALRTKSGRIFTGVNVENAAYPATICAERTAVFNAVSEGERDFEAIAVVTRNGGSPCGACRQVLAEFGLGTIVLIANEDGKLIGEMRVADLLPGAFAPGNLAE